MSQSFSTSNEQNVTEAFNRQSGSFDNKYGTHPIIQFKRQRVREHVLELLPAASSILELNCGTGEDALFFAQKGHSVHATDISAGMLRQLEKKIGLSTGALPITTELCSFTKLNHLVDKGPYDLVFSNFGGLNCTGQLSEVLQSFHSLVKPGGLVTLVVIPRFCLWEILLLLRGQWKVATRRFFTKQGRKAHLEGVFFTCWYYNPAYIRKHLKAQFDLCKLEGLCTLVPPSYYENFAYKYPRVFKTLVRQEYRLKASWPWKFIGDYFIITLRKKAGQ